MGLGEGVGEEGEGEKGDGEGGREGEVHGGALGKGG